MGAAKKAEMFKHDPDPRPTAAPPPRAELETNASFWLNTVLVFGRQVQSRLCKLYPDFDICHMPEAVMGPGTPPMVANAPVYGDQFSWHIDADPAMLPPSPWRDHFGIYTNRQAFLPRAL